MNKTTKTLAALLLMLLAAAAVPLRPQDQFVSGWSFAVTQYRLKNGLRVVLSEDPSLPLISVVVAYSAGSIREQSGQMGLAYLLENLMFQGSENVSALQHLNFVQKVGGELNANTTLDKTFFYETLPSNQLALALWLESDRMKSLAISPTSLETVKEDLAEAHLRRLATEPYLGTYSVFDAFLYSDFLYGHPLIGSGPELRSLTLDAVKSFHERYYVPSNAVLAIVGDFSTSRARELVSRYFDSIPPGSVAPIPPLPRFEPGRENTRSVKDVLLPSPGFHLGCRFDPLQTGDRQTLRILDYLLLRGQTSRLYTRIMKKDLTAYYLSGGLEERGGLPALKIFALSTTEVLADRCQKAILSEIDKLKVNLVPEAELDKAKRLFKMDYLRRLSTTLDRALYLAEAASAEVSVADLSAELDRHMKVSPQALNSVMIRFFVPSNMVILNIRNR